MILNRILKVSFDLCFEDRGPKHELTLFPAWIGDYIYYKVWDEITYPWPLYYIRVETSFIEYDKF